MMPGMSGQIKDLKSRKRKSHSDVKISRKASATRRRCMGSLKMHSTAEIGSIASGHSKSSISLEKPSRIICECSQSAGRRRCSASPELEGQDGKENKLRTGPDLDCCRGNSVHDKQEHEEMDYEDTSKNMFPDDDSNQILPVEQFFGNMDAVEDFPQRPPATSASGQREHRRRHYYAREDSDEEQLCGLQQDDTGGT